MHFPGTAGFAVLDLETTGLSPRTERIVEVAVVHVSPEGVAGTEWSTLVYPGRPTVGATHVHGIRPADVRNAPRFAQIASALVDVLAGRVLVAHNANFDVPFLRAEFERAGVTMPDVPRLCTLTESRRHLPQLLRRKLADCCAAAGVRLTGAHSALGDARATAGLLACYLHAAGPGAHAELLDRATTTATAWPVIAASAHAPVLRRRAATASASPVPLSGSSLPGGAAWRARAAQPARSARPAAPVRPTAELPRLRPGDAVVFTGGDPDVRALLEARCRERGVRVTSAVSGRTRLLVTDDVHSGTRKATRALELGTPVADTATARLLIDGLIETSELPVIDLRDDVPLTLTPSVIASL
ncbi:exonuclease, DNA polymerase III, epsilon subunit family [Quadrisphaera granulorum]|uniref:DNA polymerase III epsilon subunit family exonuclease n=1 Tax=Quadrisphaera granulorum TaxID=317664 RepID=A0A315ZTG1_9ACTN|nr:exonuclease domain-containing protein [Quadrisphaera granulorum]PWJ48453.1 DNA polymerase III epsilon subunit family exonuclease [Quadrisphaera granulorum]SZE98412.1 exonuclease, DNA polymerase III, epsilon subunit family [Quadrisphaera granulorum]